MALLGPFGRDATSSGATRVWIQPETCWRVQAPSGVVLTCEIGPTAAGQPEVRVRYGTDDVIYAVTQKDSRRAHEKAEALLASLCANRNFLQLSTY